MGTATKDAAKARCVNFDMSNLDVRVYRSPQFDIGSPLEPQKPTTHCTFTNISFDLPAPVNAQQLGVVAERSGRTPHAAAHLTTALRAKPPTDVGSTGSAALFKQVAAGAQAGRACSPPGGRSAALQVRLRRAEAAVDAATAAAVARKSGEEASVSPPRVRRGSPPPAAAGGGGGANSAGEEQQAGAVAGDVDVLPAFPVSPTTVKGAVPSPTEWAATVELARKLLKVGTTPATATEATAAFSRSMDACQAEAAAQRILSLLSKDREMQAKPAAA